MKNLPDGQVVTILLVEDNVADARLTEEALKLGKICNRLYCCHDGVEALAFLKNEPPYTDAPRPDLILLDLNMPKMDGREVLQEIENDDDLKSIPIVVLTSSEAEEDIVKSYNLRANCYISKPVDFEQFLHIIRNIEMFWFSVVSLPKSA